MSLAAVRIEGGLFVPDLFDQLQAEELPGQKPADFGLKNRPLTSEIAAVFADASEFWRICQRRLERLTQDDPATSVTRDFVLSFLSLLNYELYPQRKAKVLGGLTFAISHCAGEGEDAPPVHIVGIRQELGRVAASGRPRLSPHALVQEYLNRSEALWGLVTNGKTVRLLRDSTFIRRQCYVEWDLEAIFEQQRFLDFAVLYRLLHRSRFPSPGVEASQCWLEQYFRQSVEQGGRVRERLRDGVEKALEHLANGFLSHPKNETLRCRLRQPAEGEAEPLSAEDFYRELLRLVYRMLFLLVAEERGLLGSSRLYLEHYGIGRLGRLAERHQAYTDDIDLWLSLRVLWKLLAGAQDESKQPLVRWLGLTPLNGELFAPLDLDTSYLSNRCLLEAVKHLVYYQQTPSDPRRRVNYAALDVEELGSVYESLLDYHPQIDWSRQVPGFTLGAGSERKSTGSYYTPHELVAELIGQALDPVLEAKLASASTAEEKIQALLSIKVIDPACGSGHFLLAAARRLGKALASLRTGEEEPSPEAQRAATREVIAHCLYGVDRNPLAVELCKVALWIEAHVPGKPLTFLDHRIRCGDSLVGVLDLDVLRRGIPDEAFAPVTGEDRQVASSLKQRNRAERQGQTDLYGHFDPNAEIQSLAQDAQALDQIADDSCEAIRQKQAQYHDLVRKAEREHTACDLWTAAFFQVKTGEVPPEALLTTDAVRRCLEGGNVPVTAKALARRLRFFHWPLEFPEVFAAGGFDVVLCNPPWERIKLQEQEFFATRDLEIAHAPNRAARQRLIGELPQRNPTLWQEYQQALHDAEATSKFLRASERFSLTARGDINTYSVFSELLSQLLRPNGRAGMVVPTGIATDATNQAFFNELVASGCLVSLFDFENRERLFASVDSRYKFSLLTLRGARADESQGEKPAPPHFAFFLTRAEQLRDERRGFALSAEDFALLNPNTRTCPIFRTRQDAELTKAIYRRVPVLVNEAAGENPWGVRFLAMFHMANDSELFRTRAELEREGFRLAGNRFVREGEVWLPLYEAKMIWHYDHRYGTYAGVDNRSSTQLPTPSEAEHADPAFVVLPWYWVPADEVDARLGEWDRAWLLGFRDICRSTDERTAIFSLLPAVGANHKVPLMTTSRGAVLATCLLANLDCIPFDFVARQKIGGTSLGFFILRQLPVLPPTAYTAADLCFIVPRVLELVYTAWDIKAFADDVWREADPALRAAIQAQWEANARATANAPTELPCWAAVAPDGIPLAPFRWEAERRALLRAELDAYYARLYGLSRKQLRYILDPADLTARELADILDPWEEVADPLDPKGYAERCARSTFPGETFRVLKEKELRTFGEYRTRRLVLRAWERLAN